MPLVSIVWNSLKRSSSHWERSLFSWNLYSIRALFRTWLCELQKKDKISWKITPCGLLERSAFIKRNKFRLVGDVRGAGRFLASSLDLFDPISGVNDISDKRSWNFSFSCQHTGFEFLKVTCGWRKAVSQVIEGLPKRPFVLEENFQFLILDFGCIRNRLKWLNKW